MSSLHVRILNMILLQAFLAEASLRGGRPEAQVNEETVESSLLKELSDAVKSDGNKHISGLEASLRPMYTALPLEKDGSISHTVVRYVLHRFFAKKHGWFIRGLEPTASNHPSSGMENLAEWVPSYLQKFLEQLHGGRGTSLRELAVLAATLEDLIHKEAVGRLEMTFAALQLPQSTPLDNGRLAQVLEVYEMIYMLGGNFTVVGEESVLHVHKIFIDKVKDWPEVQVWIRNIRMELFPNKDDKSLDFGAVQKVVEEGGRRFGAYNDRECRTLKGRLLEVESTKAGRVRLSEFYKASLEGVFEFNEKQDYLRALGVLDESNVSDPHVIVPNYVASRPNCLITSKFYVVCCLNECEDLLGQLERWFQSPTAKPNQILQQVASMRSKTVEAPRKLSDSLVQRLKEIAEANSGVVPLHGRLFAQWMHHAYPRECPYPQQAGTTNPQTPDEWMQATGEQVARQTPEEVQAHIDGLEEDTALTGAEAREQQDLEENELPWDNAEELPAPGFESIFEEVDEETVEISLLKELSMAAKGDVNQHISDLEAGLQPMFKALPFEADGSISHTVVRYVLHRFFAKKYGWFMQGLEPTAANHPSSGTEGLADWVPSYLQKFLEQLQGGRGISLRELAVLAATLEDLIHKEAVGRLEMTYKALELPESTLLDHDHMAQALEVYFMIYMMGGNFTMVGQEAVLRAHKVFVDKIVDWGDVQDWIHGIQIELFPNSNDRALDFRAATKVVEEGGRRFGAYNAYECRALKKHLLEIEGPKAGRVRLGEYYKAGLEKRWEGAHGFNEKRDYLRSLGVLDESNVSDPHIIVPNYVASRPNCILASKFYVVCCLNECEDLLGQIESRFQSPTAKPDQILEQVSRMTSNTVEVPIKLSDSLVQRLNQIAQANDGVVPLHGRLFAQWMHHAYPHECPYPHQAGNVQPHTPDEWMQATGEQAARQTAEEVKVQIDSLGGFTAPKGAEARDHQHLSENELPWDEVEELPAPVFAEVTKWDKSNGEEAAPATRLAPPLRVSWLSTLTPLLKKLATFASIAFCLAFVAWKVTASGKEVEPKNPFTFVQYLLRNYGPSNLKASLLPHAQRSSDSLYC